MGIEDIFTWYQQKIGTYDKQLWETKIEQKEQRIYGLTHVQMRSAKPNTDLIDLDLVRGSSFTKAKPQYGFLKITKMATLRCIFLPFYAKWWMYQMSFSFFIFTLFLYFVQLVNIIVYFIYITNNSSASNAETISCMEILIPFIMAWILSLIQSQIVATIPDKKEHPRRSRKKLHFSDETLKSDGKQKRFSQRLNSGPFNIKFNSYLTKCKCRAMVTLRPWFHKSNVEDDGFESLVGNGSRTSEEEILHKESVQQSTQSNPINIIKDKPREAEIPVKTNESKEPIAEQDSTCIHCKRDSPDHDRDDDDEENSNCNSCKKCENWVNQLDNAAIDPVCSTDSESDGGSVYNNKQKLIKRRTSVQRTLPAIAVTSAVDSPCDTENEAQSSPRCDWTAGITTNSEDCSSDIDDVSDAAPPDRCSDCFAVDGDFNALLSPPSVKASCTIYGRDEIKKADLSMLDISWIIISKVEVSPSTPDYFYAGVALSMILALISLVCRLMEGESDVKAIWETSKMAMPRVIDAPNYIAAMTIFANETIHRVGELGNIAFGNSLVERYIIIVSTLQRFVLGSMVAFLLAVAERTFKQRLLYAKLFSHITSSRRARKSDIPHFRLNKVRNIKTWLSVRSYLKKRGPQRSVDIIVSTAFVVTLLLIAFLCAELLKETVSFSQYYLEALIWCLGLGVMILRFITLGTKINKKYRNLSVLITEQINLHLQIEQKPHKKDELNVANNVLKLAIDLLKELENPFKISGLSANPILYNMTKLVILSALSGVLSEMLGFKLKLHKIKLK